MIKQITVKDTGSLYVLDEGRFKCAHANTEFVEVDDGRYMPQYEDYVDNWREQEVCKECGMALDEA